MGRRNIRRRGHTGKLQNLGGQVLHDGSDVDGSLCSDSNVVCVLVPQEPIYQYV